jgi:hypothetical protein
VPPYPFAGLHATARELQAAVSDGRSATASRTFAISLAGLADCARWLREQGVTGAALLQGSAAWPWQAESQRRRRIAGPVDLGYWLVHEGPDALARVAPEAAWQPIMLALRDELTLFLVRPGDFAIPVNRDTARTLAAMLAQGRFIEAYPKPALVRLIDRIPGDEAAVTACLSFFLAESRGHWHNRARAKIARRLKHCRIDAPMAARLVQVIARRLIAGNFTEQFDDQLRLLLHLDRPAAEIASAQALQTPPPFVRRYGAWLADRLC